MTIDGWTSIANVSYLTVTGHFLHKKHFHSILPSIKPVDGASPAVNLKLLIENVSNLYPHLSVVAAVTDNSSNMPASFEVLQEYYEEFSQNHTHLS